MVASGLVVLDAESPPVVKEGQVRELAQLVIDDFVRIKALFVLAFPYGFGVRGFFPLIVLQGINLAPLGRVHFSVGNGARPYRFRFLGGATQKGEQASERYHDSQHHQFPVPFHTSSFHKAVKITA